VKIVIGTDGSVYSHRALDWCAEFAARLGAEVVVVHALEMPVYTGAFGYVAAPYTLDDREAMHDLVVEKWCDPLARAQVPFEARLIDGAAVPALLNTARDEDADLVVVGRRGLGGFAELLLGSTSHQLSQHLGRPLLIVP